jgi:hypothetical protein
MSTDKIPNDHPVAATEGQPAQQSIQRFIGGFGPSPEQARAWRQAAIKRRLEREAAANNSANNPGRRANNSTEPTAELEAGHPDDRASKA